jgi:hypothetical protein
MPGSDITVFNMKMSWHFENKEEMGRIINQGPSGKRQEIYV